MAKRPLIPDGKISRAIREGLALRQKLIAGGMPQPEADRIVGQGLKAAWGDSHQSDRTTPWKYLCERCKDTGWSQIAPDMERVTRLYGPDVDPEPVYVKCEPCRWATAEREKRRQTTGEFEGLAAAGQTKRSTRKF